MKESYHLRIKEKVAIKAKPVKDSSTFLIQILKMLLHVSQALKLLLSSNLAVVLKFSI